MRSLAPGSTISHYRISELVAHGGMGEVYKAVDMNLGRVVAIKIPASTVLDDAKGRQRFLREAHAVSRLQHPNICTIFEVGEENGCPFIVMEYVDGPTLQQMIERSHLEVEPALKISLQIADALEEAHQSGILHRDLKPSNIIINPRGMAMILDFGLAKRLRATENPESDSATVMQSVTTEATVIGTVSYMSPEQVRAKQLDARSDVFAFGIVLYEMLTGERPFSGAGQVEIMHAVLHDTPLPPRTRVSDIDEALEQIVLRCLAKKPIDRYQGIGEVRTELWRFVKDKGYDLSGLITATTTAPGDSRFRTLEATLQALPSKRWRKVALIAVAIGTLVLAFLVWRRFREVEFDPGSLRPATLISWKSDVGDLAATFARFSPDARRIVFSRVSGGNTDLWRRLASGGAAEPHAATQDPAIDRSPVYSPDGERIAFVSNRDGKDGIWFVDEIGGAPVLCHSLERGSNTLVFWSDDGSRIYYDHNNSLRVLDLKSDTTELVLEFPENRGMSRDFAVFRDEDRVAYVDIKDSRRDIWVYSRHQKQSSRVTDDAAPDSNPLWHPDGKRIVYNSLRDDILQPYVAFLNRRSPVRLVLLDADCVVNDISRDGTRILYSTTKDEADVLSVDRETLDVAQLTSDVGIELWPDFSFDGALVTYQATKAKSIESDRSSFSIFSRMLAGQGRATLLAPDGFSPRWSPSAPMVAFLRPAPGGKHYLWTSAAGAGRPIQISSKSVFHGGSLRLPYSLVVNRDFDWSPSGDEIAFSDGTALLAVTPDGKSERQIAAGSEPPATSPIWSHDGKRIAFLRFGIGRSGKFSSALWIAEQGKATLVDDTDRSVRLLGWSGDDKHLIISSGAISKHLGAPPQAIVIEAESLVNGSRQRIVEKENIYNFSPSLSHDGRYVAYVTSSGAVDHLNTVPVLGGTEADLVRSEAKSFITGIMWSRDNRYIAFSKHSNTREISMIDNFK
jgi:Tol biopolymer transport system component/tRNA A-37 threonylcarbamoyl transferase component Bud32